MDYGLKLTTVQLIQAIFSQHPDIKSTYLFTTKLATLICQLTLAAWEKYSTKQKRLVMI